MWAASGNGITMNTLFDILKKDRKGTFHWVEAVNDIDTAEAPSAIAFGILR